MSLYDQYLKSQENTGIAPSTPSSTSLYDQYLASQKESVAPATPVATEPGFWSKVGKAIASPFVGAYEGAKQAIDNRETPSINPMKQINVFADSFSSTIKDSGDRLNKVYETAFDPNTTDAQFNSDFASAGIGLVNSLFAPITSAIKSAEANPIFGPVATGVNAIFGAMSGAVSKPALDAVDNAVKTGSITQETADAIRQPVQEVAGLVGLVVGGAKAPELLKSITSKTKDITTAISKDANIKNLDSRAQSPLFDKYQSERAVEASKSTPEAPKEQIAPLPPERVAKLSIIDKEDYARIAPKLETLRTPNANEQVVIFGGKGEAGQYVSTTLDNAISQGISDKTHAVIVPKDMLTSTGDLAKDANGEMKLSAPISDIKAFELSSQRQTVAEVGGKINQVADGKANDLLETPTEPTKNIETPDVSRVWERLKAEHPQLEGSIGYDAIKLKEDATRAVDLIAKDKQGAYDVAMGKNVSADVTQTAVNIALAEKALAEGNTKLYSDLIRKRSLDQTRRGQEIVSERGSITDNSTAKYVKELIASRLDALGKKYLDGLKGKRSSDKGKAMEKIDAEVSKLEKQIKTKKLDTKTALALLDKLTCV